MPMYCSQHTWIRFQRPSPHLKSWSRLIIPAGLLGTEGAPGMADFSAPARKGGAEFLESPYSQPLGAYLTEATRGRGPGVQGE